MNRRDRDRSIDSDPATQGALSVPKEMEATGDPAGMHREDDLERLLDRDGRADDEGVTVRRHEHVHHDHHPDSQNPEELGEDALALATQGGGSFLDDDEESGLEGDIDRDAIASGIVPQLVGQATLESASITDEAALDDEGEVDEDAPTLPRTERPRPGRTGVQRVRRGDAR
ncbi:MAG: hypothetical protein M3Y87_01175 [Myxococcota bacterium]|nr:hypothetical protein [Myxococcota bacterium]